MLAFCTEEKAKGGKENHTEAFSHCKREVITNEAEPFSGLFCDSENSQKWFFLVTIISSNALFQIAEAEQMFIVFTFRLRLG